MVAHLTNTHNGTSEVNYLNLSDAAIAESAPLVALLSRKTAEKVALAHIALWIVAQDDEIAPDTILRTAEQAISYVQRYYA